MLFFFIFSLSSIWVTPTFIIEPFFFYKNFVSTPIAMELMNAPSAF